MASILTVTFNPALDLTSGIGRLQPHIKMRCHGLKHDPGGGGINVARVLARLGLPVRALYPAGGSTGQRLHALLDREGVEGLLVDCRAQTRQNLTIQEEETGLQYRFLLPGEALDPADAERCLEAIRALGEKPGLIVASGSLPEGVSPDLLARLGALARELGARFAVDSSGAALRGAVEAGGADIVKVNKRELFDLETDGDPGADPVMLARALCRSGRAGSVLLTLAEEGAWLFTAEGSWRARLDARAARELTVVSAVGAGDSFLGAYLAALERGESAQEALRWAVAGGSAALLTPGTELCRAEDLRALLDRIVVTPLD